MLEGSAASTPVTTPPGRPPSPQTARAKRTGLAGRIPSLASRPRGRQRRGRAGGTRGSSVRPDPQPARQQPPSAAPPGPCRAKREKGRLSRGISESISVPGSGRRVPRRKREPRPCPPAPGCSLPLLTPPRTRPYLQLLGRAQGCGRAGPSPGGGGGGQRKHGGGFLRAAQAPLSWGGRNAEEGSRRPLSRTPPPQFCLDGGSRESAPQLPFSPPGPASLSPRCLRPLLPLLPPAPSPPSRASPRPGAPPACLASWRHAHPGPSLDARGRGRSLSHVRPVTLTGASRLRLGWSGVWRSRHLLADLRPRPSAALPAPQPVGLLPGCGAGVSGPVSGGGLGGCVKAALEV